MPIHISLPVSADGSLVTAKQKLNLGRLPFKRTDNNTEVMAINGDSTGSVVIWNGSTDPGGDWTHEGQGTPTAEAAYSGNLGMDSGVRLAGQETRFDYGSNQDIAGTYDSVSFWMQPKAYPVDSDFRVFWRTSGGNNPGIKLYVEDYVTDIDLDVWQKVTMPIVDFNLGADVAKIVFEYGSKGGQHFYIDDVNLNSGGGGPKTFRTQSPDGYIFHVEKLVLVISAGDTGWAGDAFANISGGLDNGLLVTYRNIGQDPKTFWSVNAKNNAELFGNYTVLNSITFDNSEQMIVFAIDPDLSSVILVDDDDVLDITIRDNLSTLHSVRAFLHYGIEVIDD